MTESSDSQAYSPEHFKEELSKSVKGQDKLLDCLTFVARMHYLKMSAAMLPFKDESKKSFPRTNILLTGETGCGKTHTVKAFAKALGVPYVKADCSQITGDGWVGTSVVDIVADFLSKCPDGYGIIHLDEFDKILPSNGGGKDERNADFMASKMNSFLELLDGDFTAYEDIDKHKNKLPSNVENVNNALIVCTGSFQQARDREDESKKSGIGFIEHLADPVEGDSEETICWKKKMGELGYLKEVAGRICYSIELEPYTIDEVLDIINNSSESPYKKYLNILGHHNALSDEEILEIAQQSVDSEAGLRVLNSLMFEAFFKKGCWK